MSGADPFQRWRSWRSTSVLAHPNSPSGGTGPGLSRIPGPTLDDGRRPLPDPDSPAGRLTAPTFDFDAAYQGIEDKLRQFLASLTVRESCWEFVTSTSGEASIATPIAPVGVSGTRGALWIQERGSSEPAVLGYAALGTGISLSLSSVRINLSFSIPQMPSYGTVYELPMSGRSMTLEEFRGACVMFTISADLGAGWSGSLIFFGANLVVAASTAALSPLLQLPTLLATAKACVRLHGMSSVLLPVNAGATAYLGVVW